MMTCKFVSDQRHGIERMIGNDETNIRIMCGRNGAGLHRPGRPRCGTEG